VIAVASGAGMRLAVADRAPVLLTLASDPYGFPGEAATACTLIDGPIRDFNLMTDRATCRRHADRAAPCRRAGRAEARRRATAFLHALNGAVSVRRRIGRVGGAGGRDAAPRRSSPAQSMLRDSRVVDALLAEISPVAPALRSTPYAACAFAHAATSAWVAKPHAGGASGRGGSAPR